MNTLRLSLLFSCLTTAAAAQVTPFATETFEYPVPGVFHAMAGGTGWSNAWFVNGAANDDLVMFDNTIMPSFPLSDGIGGHVGQANQFGGAFRQLDLAANPELVDPAVNMLGADGNTIWVSFSSQFFQGQPQEHYGGLSLWKAGAIDPEALFLGSPWNSMGWGIDDEGGNGAIEVVAAGTDDSVATRLVYRLDFVPGMDRCRMYVNPATPYPTGPADLDEMVADLRFDEIRLSSGGNNGDAFFWDSIEFAKGSSGTLGTRYCMPNVNSTGAAGSMSAIGSTLVSTNDVTLIASDLPTNAFGFFIVSQTQSFVMNPGGSSGHLCLSGSIGRYVGPGQIGNSGGMGQISLPIDLTAVPQPSGLVSILSGETWNFQAWFRDSSPTGPTSNFTDGLQLDFL